MYRAYRLLKQARTFQPSLCRRGFGSEAKTVLFEPRCSACIQLTSVSSFMKYIPEEKYVRRVNITRAKRRETLKDDTRVTSHMR